MPGRSSQNVGVAFGIGLCAFDNLSHNLKGCGGGYGFPERSRLGAALEELAKQKDGSALATQISELQTYLDRVNLIAKG